ncbi:MAG: radical SAM protein, partial [Spirochaetota bacterium]
LVVSLSSADPAVRTVLIPSEKSYPMDQLMAALREYHAATGERVTLAWTMIAGLNTSQREAQLLAALTDGLPVKIDLIDVNDPDGKFVPPDETELNAFRDYLRTYVGMPVARRYSGGGDICASCGLLAGRTEKV